MNGKRSSPPSVRILTGTSIILGLLAFWFLYQSQSVDPLRTDIGNLELALVSGFKFIAAITVWSISAITLAVTAVIVNRRHVAWTLFFVAIPACSLLPISALAHYVKQQRPSPESLVKAARRGDIAQITRHVDGGVDVNARAMVRLAFGTGISEGGNALGAAIQQRQHAAARYLIQLGAQVNRENASKAPPLQQAILVGDPELVRLLLEHEARLTDGSFDAMQTTVLAASVPLSTGDQQIEIVNILVWHGAAVESPDLHMRAMEDVADVEFIRHLAIKRLTNPADEPSRKSDLLNAIALGKQEQALELLEESEPGGLAGERLLALSAKFGADQVAKRLIESGTRIDWPELYGKAVSSPLINAASYGHLDTTKLLVEHGANINATYTLHATALGHAAASNQLEICQFLIDRGADVNSPRNSTTPIFHAARAGNLEIIKLLVASGADPNVSAFGHTPVSDARRNGHKEIVEYLKSLN